jgi:UDP-glucose 4-epimerase
MGHDRNIIVLGASGFIGLHLMHALASRHHNVVGFSRGPSPNFPEKTRFISGDIANPPLELLEAINGSLIFHVAGSSKPASKFQSIDAQMNQDVIGTLRLVEKSKTLGARWVYVSSGGTVYGNPPVTPISETTPCNPLSTYGLMKLTVEHGVRLLAEDSVIARVSNPFGPWQSPHIGHGLVATLIHRIKLDLPVTIWGDGQSIRDYVYIKDAVDALVALGVNDVEGTFNVGSGCGMTILEVIEKIELALGKKARIFHEPARSIDVASNILDSRKVQKALDWQPQFSFERGLAATVAWQNEHELLENAAS